MELKVVQILSLDTVSNVVGTLYIRGSGRIGHMTSSVRINALNDLIYKSVTK